MSQNTDFFQKNISPLSLEEQSAIEKITKAYNSLELIPCTHCRYCISECPKHIPINRYFGIFNSYTKMPLIEKFRRNYEDIANSIPGESVGADKCISCGKCEERCPQHIEIRKCLQSVARLYSSQ
jgi:predicted aldo/keto reductase-like oxidoreductase